MREKIINTKKDKEIFKEYFYVINYPTYEKSLCEMEMKYLFERIPKEKYFFSNRYINPSRSPFIKHNIKVIYNEETLQDIIDKIKANKLCYENFKVCYIKLEKGNVDYNERLRSLKEIGLVITGLPNMQEPDITLGVSVVNGRWIFGVYKKNDYKWHEHDNKPFSYSNALGLKVAKSVVNIAVGNNLNSTLVDPCCGVGTVVIEALDLGIDVKGYEINKSIAKNAKKNLKFFGFDEEIISNKDMHTLNEKYDIAIVDIPYGLFTSTTLKEQMDIMKTARRLANRLVIVTSEDMDSHIIECGFEIIDKCHVNKNKFKRYITICR